ncbi:MAG: RHS repeat protein [Saccharothrix sp.]|nr:RHS repeat protein [Saccharothrix sp.]
MKDSVDSPKTDAREPGCPPGSGEPVDLATGQMFMTQFDLELPGMLPLILKRTHFSHYRAGRAFGRSWASSLDQRLDVEADGAYFVDDAATRLIFPLPAAGGPAVLPVEGPRWQLSLSADGTYSLHKPESGWTLAFQRRGFRTHALATITNRCGHFIEFRYEDDGIPAEVIHSGGYRVEVESEYGQVTRLRLADGHGGGITVMQYRYDERGDLVEIVNSSGLPFRLEYDDAGRITKWVDRNDEWYQYFYDPRGRVVRTDGSGGAVTGVWNYDSALLTTLYTNALGDTTTYHLNARYQVIEQIDPLGNSTRQEWDRFDRLLSRTDPLGRTTSIAYDDSGNPIAVTRPDGSRTTAEYNEFNLPVLVVEPDGATWRYSYDSTGNVTTSTDPAGSRTTYTYDELGGLASVTDPTGVTRRVEADRAGLPVALTNSLGETTQYVRDAFGRISAVVDAAGNTVRQSWTIEGGLRSRTLPDGTSATWRQDPEGNQIEYVDPLGAVTRLERTHFGLPAAEIGPDGSRLTYRYDRELRLIGVVNERGAEWRYEYDAAGNRLREIDFDGRLLDHDYDAAGQVVRRTNAAGETVEYAYDLLGKLVERRSDGNTATYRYDPVGRLLETENADVRVEFERDRLGRVVRETVNGASVFSTYDVLGRRTTRTTPSAAQSRWSYDSEGRPVALAAGGHSITFRHDALGRETLRLLDNTTAITQGWDVNSRLAHQAVAVNTRQLQQRSYQYRADGLIEEVADRLRGRQRYEFDAKGRITSADGPGRQQRFGYDEAGNIRHSDGFGDQLDRPWNYVGTMLVETGNVRYRYDAEGRVVMRQRKRLSTKPDSWRFQWNSENRLVGVTTPDGTRWRYVYDPLGRRVAKQRLTADGAGVAEQVTFHWDGTVLAEQETAGAATTWDWEPGGYRPITQVERARTAPQEWVDRRFYSIVTDVIGTASELVDSSGALAWRADSTLWGEALSRLASAASTPWRFQGQYFDQETGLHYNYARYYDPSTGRYCSVDPLGLGGGVNTRAYAQNPVNWCDPLGLAVIWGRKKCLANTDNVQTMSGWSDRPPPPPGTTRVPPSEVMDLMDEVGHPIRPNAFLDNGVPGQHYASHAERQAAVLDPNAPVRVDIPQCADCQEFFRRLAVHRGQTQVVTGPDGTRTYLPDGSVNFDPA